MCKVIIWEDSKPGLFLCEAELRSVRLVGASYFITNDRDAAERQVSLDARQLLVTVCSADNRPVAEEFVRRMMQRNSRLTGMLFPSVVPLSTADSVPLLTAQELRDLHLPLIRQVKRFLEPMGLVDFLPV